MITNAFSLKGKTILVTGASSGLGKATAIALAEMNATVIITGRNAERLEGTLKDLAGDGHQMIVADYLADDVVSTIISGIKAPLNGVVHSAGISKTLPFKFTNQKAFREIMTVNTEVPFMLTQQLVKNKLIMNNGSIVFITAMYGTGLAGPGTSAYCTSKGAIAAGAKAIALELAPQKIRVNCLAPGKILTELLLSDPNLTEANLKKDEEQYLLGYGSPEDVAYGAIYLLSEASRWVTGTNLIMDGGLSAS